MNFQSKSKFHVRRTIDGLFQGEEEEEEVEEKQFSHLPFFPEVR